MLAVATPASGAVVINEIESDGGLGPDFVELTNTDVVPADVSNFVIKDNNDANSFTIPGGTMIPAGGYYVANALGFGLGSADSARLFTPTAATLLDSHTWTSHAAATYGRCPDGTGVFTSTSSATSGAANDCPLAPSVWPGGSAVGFADGVNVFGGNLSGLAYQPSGSSTPGVLWAVLNNPGTLYRLIYDGTKWTPDTANGWSAGKPLRYPNGTGNPDAEGVTLATGDPNGVYVATERDGSGTSRPAVLRYDVSSAAPTLNATRDWNLSADLPGLGDNLGLEAVTWVPDSVLVAKGFRDEAAAATYNPATHPDHGSGLFFVGVEQDGRIVAYALNQTTDSYTKVATVASRFPSVMALEFDAETNLLWAACDNTCNGRSATLDIAQSGVNAGNFVATNAYERPTGMADLNNEGFAITPQAECVAGLKPVFWADDGNTDSHALRTGTLNCTVPATPTPPPVADTKVDGSVSAKATQEQNGRKIVVKATVNGAEALTALATGKIRAGKDSYALKPLTKSVAAGTPAILKLKPAKAKDGGEIAAALDDGKKAKAKLTVELTDAAGNLTSEALSVKLKG
jgi:hypothetical protein